MDAAYAPQFLPGSSANCRRFGWIALMAAGLVGLMIITSLWINGGSPRDDRNDLAWAPGMGTPESSPVSTGACTVEPLTVDEVMETVMNPNNGYIRLGMPRVPASESMWEPEDDYLLEQMPADRIAKDGTNESMFELAEGDTASDLMETGNDIWTCMTEGSAFQVWGLMDPILVQQVILDKFPVIRTEVGLRAYIEETGPKLFRETSAKRFSALSRFTSAQTAEAQEIRTSEMLVANASITYVRVDLADESDNGFVFRLYLREVAPGVWTIYDLTPQPA